MQKMRMSMKNIRIVLALWLIILPILAIPKPVLAQQGSYVQLTAGAFVKSFQPGLTVIASGSTSTITSTTTLIQNIYCNNQTAGAVTVTITDGGNHYYVGPSFSIPANSNLSLQWDNGLVMTSGILASASAGSSIACAFGGRQ